MKSKPVMVRMNEAELAALDTLRNSETLGEMNRSEYIRRMILTEIRRRQHKGPAPESSFATEHRTGRPKSA